MKDFGFFEFVSEIAGNDGRKRKVKYRDGDLIL